MWAQLGMTWSQVWLTIATAISVYVAILALSRLFGQRQFASCRRPILLGAGGRLLDDALHRSGTSHVEVFQAARLQGLGSLDDMAAVILERNGQFSFVGRAQRFDAGAFGDLRRAGAARSGDWLDHHRQCTDLLDPWHVRAVVGRPVLVEGPALVPR